MSLLSGQRRSKIMWKPTTRFKVYLSINVVVVFDATYKMGQDVKPTHPRGRTSNPIYCNMPSLPVAFAFITPTPASCNS